MAEDPRQNTIEVMNAIADAVQDCLPGKGFTILVFDFDDPGMVNYVSNAERSSMITAMKEFIARQEGRFHDEPETKQ